MSIIGMVARNPVPKPGGTSAGSAGRRAGISWAAGEAASAPMNCPTASAGAMRTPVAGSSAKSRNTRNECSVQPRVWAARSAGRGGPHPAPATAEVVCCGIAAAHTRTGRPASARHTADVKPLTPAPTTTICCSPTSLVNGGRLPSGLGRLLAILAAEQPVEDAESALHACRRCTGGRSGVGSQLPGLAARRLERFVARIDLHYLRLFAQGVIDEVAVGVTQPLPVARAGADGSRRAVNARRDVAPHGE